LLVKAIATRGMYEFLCFFFFVVQNFFFIVNLNFYIPSTFS
jgi:hypothetical protein